LKSYRTNMLKLANRQRREESVEEYSKGLYPQTRTDPK